MDGLLQLTLWGMLAAPVAGGIASGTGRPWGNLLTAGACLVWAGLIVFGSGLRGPLIPISAMLLGVVALFELVLAAELRDRRRERRPDGGVRAASALIALLGPVIVVGFAILAFMAWLGAIS